MALDNFFNAIVEAEGSDGSGNKYGITKQDIEVASKEYGLDPKLPLGEAGERAVALNKYRRMGLEAWPGFDTSEGARALAEKEEWAINSSDDFMNSLGASEDGITRKSSDPDFSGNLQAFLNLRHPKKPLKHDGKWGTKTNAALKDYQKNVRLKADGVIGPKTALSMMSDTEQNLSPDKIIEDALYGQALAMAAKPDRVRR